MTGEKLRRPESSQAGERTSGQRRLLRRFGVRGAAEDSLVLSVGRHWALLLNMAANLVARRLVDPTAFGAMAFAAAFLGYFQILNSTLANAVGREVPRLYGGGRGSQAEALIRVARGSLLLLVTVEAVVLGVMAWSTDLEYGRLAFTTAAVSAVFAGHSNLDKHILNSRARFYRVAAFEGITGTLTAAAMLSFVLLWRESGYFGALMAGAVTGSVVARVLVRPMSRGGRGVALRSRIVRNIVTAGGAMVLLSLITRSLSLMDRFFVEAYLGLEQLGLYSLASMVISSALLLPQAVAGSYMPRYLALAGAERRDILPSRTLELQKAVLLVSFLIIGLGLLLIRPFVAWVLPRYVVVIVPLQILLANVYFMGMAQAAYFVHLGFNRMRQMLLAGAVGVAVGLLLYPLLTPAGLIGTALASVCSFLTYALAALVSANRVLPTRGIGRLVSVTLAGLALLYLALFAGGPIWLFSFFVISGGMALLQLRTLATDRGR